MASGLRDELGRIVFGAQPLAPESRLTRPSVALGALLLACQPSIGGAVSDPGQAGGASGVGGAIGTGAAPTKSGVPVPKGGTPLATTCTPQSSETPVFLSHVVFNQAPAQKVLYSWTTPEQVAELRRDRRLLIRDEQTGMGRGYAFDVIAGLALSAPTPAAAQLAKRLSTDLFAKIRYAWPHPWATRMGWPGEDYGNQLLRIVLKDSAWTARVMDGDITVFDSAGVVVPLAMALVTPERIGAIFFVKDGQAGGLGCSGTFGLAPVGSTYREFILGSEAMVEEWSLGSEEILQELGADITLLSAFLTRMRSCSPVIGTLGIVVACEWAQARSDFGAEVSSYLRALALPSDYYLPQSSQLATILDTLEGDLFEPDPLLVIPGP